MAREVRAEKNVGRLTRRVCLVIRNFFSRLAFFFSSGASAAQGMGEVGGRRATRDEKKQERSVIFKGVKKI
jgi:hypothetical protein